MSTETYQGYANHETWHVALVINNDQVSQDYGLELARINSESAAKDQNVIDGIWTEQQAARYRLADDLKDWVEGQLPDLGDNYHAQAFMRSGFEAVEWTEVADNLLTAFIDS